MSDDDAKRFDLAAWRAEQAEATIARLVPPLFDKAAVDRPEVAEWVDLFLADADMCPSLVLAGPTGTGKTHQTYGAVKAILRGRAQQGRGVALRITNHPDLNDELRPKPNNSHAWALEPYMETELLVLDDLGAGKQTDWTGDSLYRLVDHRWSHKLPTIFTTNLPPKPLQESVGDRIVSRLADARHVAMKGDDRRWRRS